jgi:hypothetical protein
MFYLSNRALKASGSNTRVLSINVRAAALTWCWAFAFIPLVKISTLFKKRNENLLSMNTLEWIKLIAYIIQLVAEGMSQEEAVTRAARKFGVSERDIWNRGGF